ncbi:hypothetical protein Y1Q_0017449 [Alligator mississippiensis]|uniref:Uncharacterized protein n=1 Tax=Alligator mississippiensis TaxID=8496 RepID=A0A151P210_ALLMI|nr:hypothetical protein Y1Q_0017449 [Alligator mississippiensis]
MHKLYDGREEKPDVGQKGHVGNDSWTVQYSATKIRSSGNGCKPQVLIYIQENEVQLIPGVVFVVCLFI